MPGIVPDEDPQASLRSWVMPNSSRNPAPAHATLSSRELNRATLERQFLLQRRDTDALAAVEHLVGLQAQAPFSPYYQLWSRLAGFSTGELADLLLTRQVVRIVVMRGTIHLVSAPDCAMLRPLTQIIMDRDLRANVLHAPSLADVDLDRLAALARPLLEDQPRTNAELGALLAEHWPGRGPSHLAHAARDLLPLVQVPPRGVWGRSGQPRLTTAESWLGRELDPQPSPATMVLRYLGAFGPATVADIQTWSGLTRLREVVEALRAELRSFRTEDGRELFDLPDAARPAPDVPAPPRFLPDFDNVLRSHADRTRVISDTDRKRLATRNGVVPHALLVDGVVSGTWRITRSAGAATLTITPWRRFTSAERDAVADEAMRLLAFAAGDVHGHDVEFGAPADS